MSGPLTPVPEPRPARKPRPLLVRTGIRVGGLEVLFCSVCDTTSLGKAKTGSRVRHGDHRARVVTLTRAFDLEPGLFMEAAFGKNPLVDGRMVCLELDRILALRHPSYRSRVAARYADEKRKVEEAKLRPDPPRLVHEDDAQ